MADEKESPAFMSALVTLSIPFAAAIGALAGVALLLLSL